jgi:hypothetical protein
MLSPFTVCVPHCALKIPITISRLLLIQAISYAIPHYRTLGIHIFMCHPAARKLHLSIAVYPEVAPSKALNCLACC